MSAPFVFTFADVLEHLNAFAGHAGRGADQYLLRECARAAYREVGMARDWTFFRRLHRVTLQEPQSTGTVVFDLTGGTYERQLTLTDATWPSWANDASVRLGEPDIVCDIENVQTSTVVTLDANMCPVEDVASTTYTLWPRYYRLPNDFASMVAPMSETDWRIGEQVSHEFIQQLNRNEDRQGSIEKYAFGAPPDLYGAMAFFIHPRADDTKSLDIPYVRRQRDIVYTGHDSRDSGGTITVSAGSASVAGTSTTFAPGMINSVLRIGDSATYCPDGIGGKYPYAEQRAISVFTNATTLTLDANVAADGTDVHYRVTDPLDLDVVLYDAYLRCCEKHLARMLNMKTYVAIEREYRAALLRAQEADCRGVQPVVAGVGRRYTSRLTDSSHRDLAGFS